MMTLLKYKFDHLPVAERTRIANIQVLVWSDLLCSVGAARMAMVTDEGLPEGECIYRINISASNSISVMCFGFGSVDDDLKHHYDDVDALPEWVQERLAALMMLSFTPPTEVVPGVGKRVSKDVFWVFKPKQ